VRGTPATRLTPAGSLRRPAETPRDNTVTTNALSTWSRSSTVLDGMRESVSVGRERQAVRKVEGLVTFTGRGSSNLPGRIGKPRKRGAFVVLRARAVLAVWNVGRQIRTRPRTGFAGATATGTRAAGCRRGAGFSASVPLRATARSAWGVATVERLASAGRHKRQSRSTREDDAMVRRVMSARCRRGVGPRRKGPHARAFSHWEREAG